MKKSEEPVIFRKKDEIVIPHIFHQLRLFKNRGCLLFICCETTDVENELAERIKKEMGKEFECHSIFLSPIMLDPFAEIEEYLLANPTPHLKSIFLIRSIVSLKEDEPALSRFFQGINLNRDKIGQQSLCLIFFVDDSLLNLIIFKSPDFFTFKSGVFRFGDEAKIRREIAQRPQDASDNELRLADLAETFKTHADKLPDETKADLAFEIGTLHQQISNIHEALKYYEVALPLFKKTKNQQGEARTIGNIGIVYHNMGELEQALKYMKQALEIHKQIGYRQGEADNLNNIGMVYRDMSELGQALKYHKQALEIHKQIGYREGEASALGNIGIVYREMGQLEQALKYMKQALEINKQIGYRQGEANDLGNIGIVYREMGQLEQALKYMKQALEINKQIGYRQGEANDLGNIGIVYRKMGELEQALEYHKQALEINKQIGYRQGETSNLDNIGIVYRDMGQLEQVRASISARQKRYMKRWAGLSIPQSILSELQ